MSNKAAISLIYTLINDLENKAQKLTDQNRFNAMMNLIKELEKIKNQMVILGFEEVWIEAEKQMQSTPQEYGTFLIKTPTTKDRGDKIRIIDFTNLVQK